MPGVHKKTTISFRVSEMERMQIEANIKASGMLKQDYFVKASIYNHLCVVGKKETIYPLVGELEKMQKILKNLSNEFMNNEVSINEEKLYGLEEQYKAMVSAIIKMLDAAEYLWNPDKEKSPK